MATRGCHRQLKSKLRPSGSLPITLEAKCFRDINLTDNYYVDISKALF